MSALERPNPFRTEKFSRSLHGLRGLAACIVAFYHAVLIVHTFSPEFNSVPVLINGPACVVLFFVMSGLVLAPSAFDATRDVETLTEFYTKRFFRLMPLLMVLNLFFGVGWVLFLNRLPYVDPVSGNVGTKQFIEGFVGASMSVNGPSWSLFVEIIASGMMPLMVWIAQTKASAVALVLVSAVLAFAELRLPYHSNVYLFAFAIGATMPLWANRMGQPSLWIKVLVLLGAVLFYFLAPILSMWAQISADRILPLMVLGETVLIAPAVAYLFSNAGAAPWLQSKLMVWLGELSFGIYLIHFNIVLLVYNFVRFYLSEISSDIDVFFLTAVITMGITIPLSIVCRRLVEIRGLAVAAKLLSFRRNKKRFGIVG